MGNQNTIKGIAAGVVVSATSVTDDSYAGVMLARHPEYGMVFVWPYSEGRFPASCIAVKGDFWVDSEPEDFSDGVRLIRPSGTQYLHTETVADIAAYDNRTGKITVPFGPAGMKRAVARWLRDNMVPFTIEVRDYRGAWVHAETVHGLENVTERLDSLRADHGVNAYRINR